jgi:hypothetical protein
LSSAREIVRETRSTTMVALKAAFMEMGLGLSREDSRELLGFDGRQGIVDSLMLE